MKLEHTIRIRVPTELLVWLEHEAQRERLSFSATVRRLLWAAKEGRLAGTSP